MQFTIYILHFTITFKIIILQLHFIITFYNYFPQSLLQLQLSFTIVFKIIFYNYIVPLHYTNIFIITIYNNIFNYIKQLHFTIYYCLNLDFLVEKLYLRLVSF